MMTTDTFDSPQMIETSCPEYFVTEIGRHEPAGGDNIRFYCCSRKGKFIEPQYTVVLPIDTLEAVGRMLLRTAENHRQRMAASSGVAH